MCLLCVQCRILVHQDSKVEIKMERIRTPYKYRNYKRDKETPDSVSMTVPGESTPIREMLRRHAGGIIDITKERHGYYSEDPDHDDPDFEKIARSDIFDQQNALEQTVEMEIDKAIEAKRSSQKQKDNEEAITDEVNEESKSDNVATEAENDDKPQ